MTVDGVAAVDPRTLPPAQAIDESRANLHLALDELGNKAKLMPYPGSPTERAGAEVVEAHQTVDTLFTDFYDVPDPVALREPIAMMQNTMRSLGVERAGEMGFGTAMLSAEAFANFDDAKAAIAEWTGLAATAFINTYADNFEARTANLYAVAGVLLNALYAEQAIWLTARADISEIAVRTADSMLALARDDGIDWELVFKVLTVVTSVAAGVVGGPASVGVALTVISAASGAVEDEAGRAEAAQDAVGTTRQGRIEGETPLAILQSAREQLTTVIQTVSQAETAISVSLAQTAVMVEAYTKLFRFPDLALAFPGSWATEETMGQHD